MIIRTLTCAHCGTEYMHQFSGSYEAVDTPKQYRSDKYCPECQKAIYDALLKVPVKFKNMFVFTDEVTLETLQQWEREWINDRRDDMFPMMKQVFAGLVNATTNDYTITEKVKGRGEFKGRTYIYTYWKSKPEDVKITVERRVNIITNEILNYIIN